MGPSALISIKNLNHNYNVITCKAKDSKVFPVIKANAYGHGIVQIATELEKNGVDGFCVAHFDEIETLLKNKIKSDILYLGGMVGFPKFLDLKDNIIYTISSIDDFNILSNGARKRAHIKIDTGMNRLGVKDIDEVFEIIKLAIDSKKVILEGVYSHFASSDDISSNSYKDQLDLFLFYKKKILSRFGLNLMFHIANSSAIFRDCKTHLDLIRPGLSLYGLRTKAMSGADLKSVMEFKSIIVHTKKVKIGESIGYNKMFIAKNNLRIGIIQAGYADGIFTDFMNSGEVVYKNKKVPILGKISMDTICVDITSVDADKGDIVSIWGDPHNLITLESLSEKYNKIPYEFLTSISNRVRKEYIYL